MEYLDLESFNGLNLYAYCYNNAFSNLYIYSEEIKYTTINLFARRIGKNPPKSWPPLPGNTSESFNNNFISSNLSSSLFPMQVNYLQVTPLITIVVCMG